MKVPHENDVLFISMSYIVCVPMLPVMFMARGDPEQKETNSTLL